MITLIDNEVVKFHNNRIDDKGGIDEEEYIKTEEYKDISTALGLLAKHCPSLVVSGSTVDDRVGFVYNRASSEIDHPLARNIRKLHGNQRANATIRGAELSAHISSLIEEAEKEYKVNAEAVIQTITLGRQIKTKLSNMDDDERDEILEKMCHIKSDDETEALLRDIDVKTEDETDKLDKIRSELESAFGESVFAKTAKKEDINVKDMERTIKLATGKDTKVCKMSDPEVIKPLAKSLKANLGATVAILTLKFEDDIKNGETAVDVEIEDGIDELAKKCDIDPIVARIAACSSLAVALLKSVKKQFDLPDGLFTGYIKQENL